MPSTSPKLIATSSGRRKTSKASVRLYSGSGGITVNGKPVDQYFPGSTAKIRYQLPFITTDTLKKYSATVVVAGGGYNGQLDAMVLGLSKCLVIVKADHKPILRQNNLLTRDSRKRQRRMIGMGGKSRRKKQSPKR